MIAVEPCPDHIYELPRDLARVTYAKDQPAILSADGRVTSAWYLTFKERLHILFFGRIWLQARGVAACSFVNRGADRGGAAWH